MTTRWTLALVWFTAMACHPGGRHAKAKDTAISDVPEEPSEDRCVETAMVLDWEERSPGGLSAAVAMAELAPGSIHGAGAWLRGERFQVTGTVAPDTSMATWVDSEPSTRADGDDTGLESGAACLDYLVFVFRFQVSSDDGKLDLDTILRVKITEDGRRTVVGGVDPEDLSDVVLEDFTPSDGGTVTGLSIEVYPDPVHEELLYAALHVHAEGHDGESDWGSIFTALYFTYGGD